MKPLRTNLNSSLGLQKSAGLGAILAMGGKGALSHTASILGGSWGTGGLLNLIGRILGRHTKSYFDPKLNKYVTKLLPMSEVRGKLGILDGVGHRLSAVGNRLTKWTEKLHKNYMKSVDDVTGSHKNWKGRALRFGLIGPAAIGGPIVYTSWADSPEQADNLAAAPGKAMNLAFHYGSVPGLIATGLQKGFSTWGDKLQQATVDGAAISSKLINYELANQNRMAYLAGVLNPELFANKTDAAVQQYIQALNSKNAL